MQGRARGAYRLAQGLTKVASSMLPARITRMPGRPEFELNTGEPQSAQKCRVIVLPLSALGGAALLMVADLGARTVISPGELPIGVITAFLGAPFFAVVLWTSRRDLV